MKNFRKRNILYIKFIISAIVVLFPFKASAQEFAIKNNFLGDLTGSLNLAGEYRCSDKTSVQLGVSYNPWTFSDNKKLKHILIQPEYRYWFSDAFMGHFLGLEAQYAQYNVAGVSPIHTIKDHRHQGNLYGVGLTYGYQWMISTFWNIEANLSLGYVHFDYDKYGPEKGAKRIDSSTKDYFGPVQAGISIVYFLR